MGKRVRILKTRRQWEVERGLGYSGHEVQKGQPDAVRLVPLCDGLFEKVRFVLVLPSAQLCPLTSIKCIRTRFAGVSMDTYSSLDAGGGAGWA